MLPLHPLSAAFRRADSDDEMRGLVESIKRSGFRKDKPIITYQGQVLDGGRRQLAAKRANVEPIYREWSGEHGTITDFVLAENLHRRHDDQSQRAVAGMNVAKVMQVQKNGESAPAGAVHVSKETIIEAAKVTGSAPRSIERALLTEANTEPEVIEAVKEGAVKLRDAEKLAGKPAAQQKRIIKRVKEGKEKSVGKALERERKRAAECPRDALGQEIPHRLRDAMGDTKLAEFAKTARSFRRVIKEIAASNPWVLLTKLGETLEAAAELCENAIPHAVHPKCQGKGCSRCKMSGFVPESMLADIQATQEWE